MKNKKQVLIVESDTTISVSLTIVLQEIGLQVFTASDGEDALHSIQANDLDLVITNLNLPLLSGLDLIKKTRSLCRHAEIIVLSDTVNDAVYELMRKLGVFRLFRIPFKIDEIKDAVLRGLSSNRNQRLSTEVQLPSDFLQDFIPCVSVKMLYHMTAIYLIDAARLKRVREMCKIVNQIDPVQFNIIYAYGASHLIPSTS